MAAFDLSIESINNRRFRVTVIDSPAGTASAEINSPFTFDELAELSDALGGRAGLSATELQKYQKQFGETLFNAVFADAIRYAYTASQKATGSAALNIRLRLDKAGDLAALPWQWINDPDGEPITVSRLDKAQVFAPVGGLHETLRYGFRGPRLILAIGAAAALTAFILAVVLRPAPDVDLVITSVRFLPPRPAPGQIFKVTMAISNQGSTRSGPFEWAWFRGDSRGARPDLTGKENGLGPGDTITVRGEYSFGWWDLYDSTGEVDLLRESSDKDFVNNTTTPGFAIIQTSSADFVIDFTIKPPAEPLTTALDLKTGNEFKLWSLIPQVDKTGRPECVSAILKIVVLNNENFVRPGLPGNAQGCDDLPMIFTFDEPVGAAQINFVTTQPGNYTLILRDKNDKLIDSVTKTALPVGENSIRLPASGLRVRNDGAVTIRFQGASGVRVQKLTLSQPDTQVN